MDPCISKARSLPFSSFEDATESGIGKQIPPRSMELNQTALQEADGWGAVSGDFGHIQCIRF